MFAGGGKLRKPVLAGSSLGHTIIARDRQRRHECRLLLNHKRSAGTKAKRGHMDRSPTFAFVRSPFRRSMLEREEYVEQAYLFKRSGERLRENMATQDLLVWIKEEILSTTRLPMAMDFLAAELKLHGMFAPAMAKLSHYFTPFQTYVIAEAENERGKFDIGVALKILEREAEYRAEGAHAAGILPLSIRMPVPQSIGLRSRIGGHGRGSDLRRCLAGMDSHRPAAGWTDRHRRSDLRPQRAIPVRLPPARTR